MVDGGDCLSRAQSRAAIKLKTRGGHASEPPWRVIPRAGEDGGLRSGCGVRPRADRSGDYPIPFLDKSALCAGCPAMCAGPRRGRSACATNAGRAQSRRGQGAGLLLHVGQSAEASHPVQ